MTHNGSIPVMQTLEELSKEELISLMERLQELIHRDSLTGLYDARYFKFVLETEVERSARYGYEFCVLVMDVDRFK